VFLLLWSFQGARGSSKQPGPSKLNSVLAEVDVVLGELEIRTAEAIDDSSTPWE